MATGAVYQLLINTGMQDKLLTATSLLNDRMREVRRVRCKNPAIRDTTPTLADIERTHLLFINAHFKPFVAIGYEYQVTGPQFGIVNFGGEIVFSIPQFGDFFHDMVLNIQLSSFSAAPGDKVFYCDFPGHRLLQLTKFEVNNLFLDQYDYNVYNFHYNFFITKSKQKAWLRAMGQEVPEYGYLTNNPGVDEFRELKRFVAGPQTPKATQPVLDLWMPLLFWFSRDPRLSIPSIAIPYGQRFMRFTLAEASQMVTSVSGGTFTPPIIVFANLYINNIFMNPEISNLFIKRVGFSMIRVHLQQSTPESTNADQIRIDQMKFPVETLYIGLQPNINQTGPDNFTDWYKYYNVTTNLVPTPVAIPNTVPIPPYILAFTQTIWRSSSPTILTLQVENHGINFYAPYPEKFFSEYIPYQYGQHIVAPRDIGMLMIPFNLYPGVYQPSGYLNLSNARETFVNFTAQSISSVNPATFYIIGIAINFVLLSEGQLVLRFSV